VGILWDNMILYTVLSKKIGWNYSSLLVTYPVMSAPADAIALGIKSAKLHRTGGILSKQLALGEIPTTLPLKVARSIHGKKSSGVIFLGNDEFIQCTSTDILLNTDVIVLAVQQTQHIRLEDGLAYLLNEFDKYQLSTKRFILLPCLSSDYVPTTRLLESMRDDTYFDYINLKLPHVKSVVLDRENHLPFVTLAEGHFCNRQETQLVLEKSDTSDFQDGILSNIFSKKELDLSVNLNNCVEILKTEPLDKPVLAGTFRANEVLLRSIVITNWLNRPKDLLEIQRGSRLALRYHLTPRSWNETLAIYFGTFQWDQVSWMGFKATKYLKKYTNDIKVLSSVISLIGRRNILLFFFPIFSVFMAYSWMQLTLQNQHFLPLVILSFPMGYLGPLFSINIFYRFSRNEKMEKIDRFSWASSFLLVGATIGQTNNLPDGFYALGLLPILFIWISWCFLPLPPKIGRLLFGLLLVSIPLSSLTLGKNNWDHYFVLFRHAFNNPNVVLDQLNWLFSNIIHLFIRFFSTTS